MAIKIKNNNVEEIQSVKNDFKIPTEDFIKIRQHIQDLNCITMGRAQTQMQIAKVHQLFMDKMHCSLEEAIRNNDVKSILEFSGIECEEDEDGYLTISNYSGKCLDVKYADLGINENNLLKKIKAIKGNATFSKKVTDLGALKYIGKDAYFDESTMKILNGIEEIGGDLSIMRSEIENLGTLKKLGGSLRALRSKLKDFGSLETVGGDLYLMMCKIENHSNLKEVNGGIYPPNALV